MNATTSFSYSDNGFSDVGKSRLAILLARAATWVAERDHRQQVMLELRAYSDRELADIGLNRRDIPRVFDPAFVATYRS